VDVETGKAVRIAARESSKALAREMHPEIESKNQQQMLAYREMSERDLFDVQNVKVELTPEDFPGFKGERVVCERCGEGINFKREIRLRRAHTLSWLRRRELLHPRLAAKQNAPNREGVCPRSTKTISWLSWWPADLNHRSATFRHR